MEPVPTRQSTIPPEAICVFTGAIFEVYQWQQKLYDGTFATFEKLRRPDTVVVIAVTESGEFLATHEEQPGKGPFMGLPGGRVDTGEEPLVAAKRELLEETGYEGQEWELYFTVQPVSKIDWTIYYFIARGCKKIADQSLDSGEKIQVSLMNLDAFVDIIANENFREPDLTIRTLKARLDPEKWAALQQKLLGKDK